MYYCNVIENEIVTAPRALPTEIPVQDALINNWYKVVFLNMPHHLIANPVTELIEMKMRISGDVVECWHEVVQKTSEQIVQTQNLLMMDLRNRRNDILLRSDWTQLPNAPLTEIKKLEWENYRQQLRDFPNTVNLANIIWPTEPSKE
jgi:hypothetical protein